MTTQRLETKTATPLLLPAGARQTPRRRRLRGAGPTLIVVVRVGFCPATAMFLLLFLLCRVALCCWTSRFIA